MNVLPTKVLIAISSLVLAGCVIGPGVRSTVEQPNGAKFMLIDNTRFQVPPTLKEHQIYVTVDKSPRLTAFFKSQLTTRGYRVVERPEEASYVLKVIGGARVRAYVPGFIKNDRTYTQSLAYLAETGEPICATECGKWQAFSHQVNLVMAGGVAGVDPEKDTNKLGLSITGLADDMPSLMMDELIKVVLDRIVNRLDQRT